VAASAAAGAWSTSTARSWCILLTLARHCIDTNDALSRNSFTFDVFRGGLVFGTEMRGAFISSGEDGTATAWIARHQPGAGANGTCDRADGRFEAGTGAFVFASPETDNMGRAYDLIFGPDLAESRMGAFQPAPPYRVIADFGTAP
jgi:hypothetical protein